jgi:PAS domain S-box-containing protein
MRASARQPELRPSEERLRAALETAERVNRSLAAVSNSRIALVRAQSEADLVQAACQIVVRDCGHAMVWIGLAEHDKAKTIRAVASAGFEEGYLDTLRLTWADTERGRGPTGTAIRTGQVCRCQDMLADPKFTPWRAEAIKRGFASSIAFPLRADGEALGALTIYSPQPGSVSPEEERLLAQLAEDLALGIRNLRLKAAHARAEEKLRAIFESIGDGFFNLDPEWRVTFVNEKGARLLSQDPAAMLGRNLWELFPDAVGSSFQRAYERAVADQVTASVEAFYPPLHKWFEARAYPSAEGLSVFFQDISARKQADHALRRTSERLDLLADTAGQLLRADSPQRLVETLCRKVMVFLDCQVFFNFLIEAPAHTDGRESAASSPPPRLHLNACAGISDAAARQIEWLDYGVAVCGCVARDGARIVAENIPETPDPRTELIKSFGIRAYACHPLVAHGRLLGTLSFGTRTRAQLTDEDLSLMKAVADQVAIAMQRQQQERAIQSLNAELEERVRARTAELEAANKELEAFCYSVSHDLRAPLRTIDGFSQALLEDLGHQLKADDVSNLQRVRAGCQRMGQLIDDLLKLSRLSRAVITTQPVNLSALAEAVAAELRHTAPERQVEFHIAGNLQTAGDPQLLQVALMNLLGNAWKFTGQSSDALIEVGARERGSLSTVFFVRDNGAGFDMKYADKLFAPFQRLHGQAEFPGLGIGLATVQRIIRRHGGRVWAEAAPGQGATFFFTLNA